MAGDIPKLVEDKPVEDPAKRIAARRASFLQTNSQFHTHHQPEGDYALMDVCELDDLRKGVTVRHQRRGFGVIRSVTVAGNNVHVSLDFGGASSRTATVSGTELKIVVE